MFASKTEILNILTDLSIESRLLILFIQKFIIACSFHNNHEIYVKIDNESISL